MTKLKTQKKSMVAEQFQHSDKKSTESKANKGDDVIRPLAESPRRSASST